MTTEIEVRFSDEDSQGHVSHIPIVEWIAHARVKFIDDALKMAECVQTDYTLVRLEVDFTGEIKYGATLKIEASVFAVGKKSLTTKYSVREGDEELATATCVNVFFDTQSGSTIIISDTLRAILGSINDKYEFA